MTFRPHIAGNPADAPRRSGKVKAVAEILDMAQSHVRQLIESGELETHGVGKRGVRVYLDSVADYQQRKARTYAQPPLRRPPERKPKPASLAAHRAALASLKAAGCLKRRPVAAGLGDKSGRKVDTSPTPPDASKGQNVGAKA
jgi:hypothetical protein